METPKAHIVTNIHPNFRIIGLNYIRQVRRAMRAGTANRWDARAIIKRQQRDLADKRQQLKNARY